MTYALTLSDHERRRRPIRIAVGRGPDVPW